MNLIPKDGMKRLFIVIIFSPLLLYGNGIQNLKRTLAQLKFQLESLESAFIHREVKTPYEIKHIILQNLIPESPISSPDEFKKILNNIGNFMLTSREYKEAFQHTYFNELLIKKLFMKVSPNLLDQLKFPEQPDDKFEFRKKASEGIPFLETVKNILYYIFILRRRNISELMTLQATPKQLAYAIHYIVDAGVDPNFFLTKDYTIFGKALMNDLPNTVKYLIEKGADINFSTNINKGNLKRLQFYHQIPFIVALTFSPRSALILLRDPRINLELIQENFKFNRIFASILIPNKELYAEIFDILLDDGFSPNEIINSAGKITRYETISELSIFTLTIVFIKGPISLIQKMLEKGADIGQISPLIETTPLAYVEFEMRDVHNSEEIRTLYKEIYDLIKKHQTKKVSF